MKITYQESIESRKAFSRKMSCSHCGSPYYQIVEQVIPETKTPWVIRCADCEFEGPPSVDRNIAIARWKQLCQ